jgi:hypothetical protein
VRRGAKLTGESSGKRVHPPHELREPRKPYRTPRLECHGRLVDLTRFGGSQVVDSGGGLGQQF